MTAPDDLVGSALRTARALGFQDEARKILAAHPRAESASEGRGNLILVFHSGRAPKKVSRAMIVPSHEGIPVKIALPALVRFKDSGAAARIEVTRTWVAPRISDDVAQLADQALDERKVAIMGRLIARAVAKEIAAQQARNKGGLWAEIGVRIAGAVTENADTRSWDTLPARVYVARLRLSPGRHDVKLVVRGRPVAAWDVEVGEGLQVVFLKERTL